MTLAINHMSYRGAFLLIAIVTIGSIVYAMWPHRNIDLSKLIQKGMSKTEVETILTDLKVEYSWVEDDLSFYAIVREHGNGLTATRSVRYIVHIKDGVVKSVEAKEGFTGL